MNNLQVNKFCKHNIKSKQILELQKKAQITNSKCSILSPDNKTLGCLDQTDTEILLYGRKLDNYTMTASHNDLVKSQFADYNCKDTLCLLKKKYQKTKSDELLHIMKKN